MQISEIIWNIDVFACLCFLATDVNFPLCIHRHFPTPLLLDSFVHSLTQHFTKIHGAYWVPGFEPRVRDAEMKWKTCNLAGGKNNTCENQTGCWYLNNPPEFYEASLELRRESTGLPLIPHLMGLSVPWNQGVGWGAVQGKFYTWQNSPSNGDCVIFFFF